MDDSWERDHRVVLDSLHYAGEGKAAEAFEMIDDALEEATRNNDTTWLKTLYGHAAVVAHIAGDRRREIGYKERTLQFVNDYPFALHNLAQLLFEDGQINQAKRYAAEAFKLTSNGQTESERDLAAALLKQWPDLSQNG
jgi:tetratricopeptide (TPR) repeat protein